MNPADLFGKPKHGGGAGYRIHKLKDGKNIFRIGPPYKSLAAEGRWFWYTRQHFGYYGVNPKEPDKTVARPFLCPLEIDRRTEMVKVPCKECEKTERQQDLLKSRKEELEAQGLDGDAIAKATGVLGSWVKAHNLDKKYNVLAKNEKGEWGVLALPFKAKEAFDAAKADLLAQGIDPIDVDGCWMVFTRTGEGRNTVHSCAPLMETEKVNGKLMKSEKLDTLTEADFEDIIRNCPDLPTLGRKLTQEQIEELVNCSGDPAEVDRIMEAGKKVESSKVREASPAPTKVQPKPAPAPEVSKKVEPKVEVKSDPAPVAAEDDEEAALLAQLAAARAKKAAAAKVSSAESTYTRVETKDGPKVQKVEEPQTKGDPSKMDDEEFAKLFTQNT